MLIDTILDEAKEKLHDSHIVTYSIGISYVAVKTNIGTGLAYTFRESIPQGCSVIDSNITGAPALDIAAWSLNHNPLKTAIGLATINSVLNCDGSEDIAPITDRFLFENKQVSMIGNFKPLAQQLRNCGSQIRIFELKEDTGTLPSSSAKRFLPSSDIIIISGTTLINHTLDDFIPYLNKDAKVVFMGPSTPASMALCKYGAIATSSVVNEDSLFDIVQKGGGMRHIRKASRKIWINKKV